jgi:uncharacterized protein (TIGR03086 family)
MGDVAQLKRAVGELNRVVENMKPEQLDDPSPCAEWKVRDVVNHVTAGGKMFQYIGNGGAMDESVMALFATDHLGEDYKGALRSASDAAVAAFDQPGILEQTLHMPMGDMPGAAAVDVAVYEVTTHACDIAHATNQTIGDTELVEMALANGKGFLQPELRAPGFFDAEQAAPAGASATDRLLAFGGRSI